MDIFRVREEMRWKPIREIPLRVTYYARVSSERDEQLNSLKNQSQYYEEYIKSNPRWTFVEGYIDEGISGISTQKRENFHRMVEDAMAGKFDYIVTKEISRFARNTLDSIGYTRKLLSNGVAVFFQNDNINTLDEDSEFRLTIMAGVAQDEIRKLSSRVKFGHKQAIKNGVVLGNSHLYGYHKQNGRLTICEEEAEMVRFIFENYASGKMTTPKIEKALFDMGYRNYKGGKINRGVIQHIITNPKYKGYYVGNKVKIVDLFTKKQLFLPEEEWVMYKDETGEIVPAIVSEELWEEANRIFKMRGDIVKSRRTSFKADNLFTGKIICSLDQSPYWLKARIDRKGNNNSRWVCSHKIKEGSESCESFGIMERELLEILAEVLREVSGNFDDVIDKFIEIYEKSSQSSDFSGELKKCREEMDKINAKKDKLLEYNLDGKIEDREFIRRNDLFNEELRKWENRISEIEKERDMNQLNLEEIYGLKKEMKGFSEVYPEDFNQSLINLFIDKIYAEPVDERTMKLKIVLNTGETRAKAYERHRTSEKNVSRSGHMFKKMIEAQEKMMAEKKNS